MSFGDDSTEWNTDAGTGARRSDSDEDTVNEGGPAALPGIGISAGAGGSTGLGSSSANGSSNGGGTASAATPAGGTSGMGGSATGGSATGGSSASPGTASATCALSVSVTTTAPGGRYQPRNVGAIWIADSTGRFLKSLDVWGNRRLSHVNAWNAATRAAGVAGNKVDAISSATLTSHRTHDAAWNCEDFNGQVVPDGAYRVYFEVADSNNAGPNYFEAFSKGPTGATLQSSATNFNGITMTFTP